jgi:hypothetical protein
MRAAFCVAVLLAVVGAVIAASVQADDAKTSSSTQGAPPSDKEIINVVGDRMSKVFPKFGYPEDMFASDASSDTPAVFLDYGSYGFKIRKKVVYCCMFFTDWKGTILGAKMGDSLDDVVKKLGKPKTSDKDDDGLAYMLWSFKEWDGTLEVDFDKDNKMKRAVVSAD